MFAPRRNGRWASGPRRVKGVLWMNMDSQYMVMQSLNVKGGMITTSTATMIMNKSRFCVKYFSIKNNKDVASYLLWIIIPDGYFYNTNSKARTNVYKGWWMERVWVRT